MVGDLIGAGAAQERGVVGETPNLAARLQALAEPDTLVIADEHAPAVGGLFDCRRSRAAALAGFAEPSAGLAGRWAKERCREPLRGVALDATTPLVGRDEEIELLLRRWQQAKGGEGRVVLISGEPGIGKSRLTAALLRTARRRAAYAPALFLLAAPPGQRALSVHRAARTRRRFRPRRHGRAEARQAGANCCAGRREMTTKSRCWPSCCRCRVSAADLNLSPQRKREKLFEALLAPARGEARRRPVLMVFEDAHWIDPTSRELLDLTVDRVRRLPVLLVITFRPEFQPPWGGQPHVTTLGAQSARRTRRRGAGATAGRQCRRSTAEIVAEIVERTDGVPLFVEELTKAVLESAGAGGPGRRGAGGQRLPRWRCRRRCMPR